MNDEMKRKLERIDRQQNRVHLFAQERQAMIGILACRKMFQKCVGELERAARHRGGRTLNKLKSGFALMNSGIEETFAAVSLLQHDSIASMNGYISYMSQPGAGRIDCKIGDLDRLILAARMGACRNCLSCMDKCEWQKCKLMQLMSRMPTHELINERQQFCEGVCPYAMMQGETFDYMWEDA